MLFKGYIENMRCPQCGNNLAFLIECQAVMLVTARALEVRPLLANNMSPFNDDSTCACVDCGYSANVGDFRKKIEQTK